MIKLSYFLRRREGLSAEEFHRYWREDHGPLVRDRARALRIRRYVQHHGEPPQATEALAAGRGSAEQPFDGVAEVWWDSLEAIQEAVATEDGARAADELLEDERRFIDVERSPVVLGEELVFVEG